MSEELAGGKLLLDEPAEAVARLTLNRPDSRNALDHELLDGLAARAQNRGSAVEQNHSIASSTIGHGRRLYTACPPFRQERPGCQVVENPSRLPSE